MPWPDDDAHVPYKVRYQYIVGKKGADPVRRYYRPDLDALIVKPSALRRSSRVDAWEDLTEGGGGVRMVDRSESRSGLWLDSGPGSS